MSRAAVFSTTQSLRALLEPSGVRVHAVLAGPIDTDLLRAVEIPKSHDTVEMEHPTQDEVAAFLAQQTGETVTELEPLTGGAWSSAWGFRAGTDELVVRFGPERSWYEADRLAAAFSAPDLPIPEVREVGTTSTGLAYAISVRRHGGFLEDTPVEHAAVLAPTLTRLLVALSRVPAGPDTPVMWHPAGPAVPSWRELVLGRLVDDPSNRVHGWRAVMDADRQLSPLAAAVCDRVRTLIDACPERRDLVHGDLLHGNVLVSPDLGRVEAVISWKLSLRGDFLYDAAWCTVWGPVFYPGIAALDPLSDLLRDDSFRGDANALTDAAVRHHCYELQIAFSHLGWSLGTWDPRHVRATIALLTEILDRGPVAVSPIG